MPRGRPKKIRPKRDTPITAGMSLRDIAAALGERRQRLAEWKQIAEIPKDEFEDAVENDDNPVRAVKLLARRQAGKSPRERRCPHCGGLLRIENL